jgi:hypothetical protein
MAGHGAPQSLAYSRSGCQGSARWLGEVEGTMARLTGEEVWRRGRQIGQVMNKTTSSDLVTGNNAMGARTRRAYEKMDIESNGEAFGAFYRVGNG